MLATGLFAREDEATKVLDELVQLHYTAAQLRFAFTLLVEQDARPQSLFKNFESQLMRDFLNRGMMPKQAKESLKDALRSLAAGNTSTLEALGLESSPQTQAPNTTHDAREAARLRQLLASDTKQRQVADLFVASVRGTMEQMYFVNGRAGAGKTTLTNYISHFCATDASVCLNCATTGQAALRLDEGRTAHSLFGIPVNDEDELTCAMTTGCAQARRIATARVIQWDEFPMTKRAAWETVLRLLADLQVAYPADYVPKIIVC